MRQSSALQGARDARREQGGGAGPVSRDELMFINSGYGLYLHMPGNVLLATGRPDTSGEQKADSE